MRSPDGSLMIADWYDPGVGDIMGDQVKGEFIVLHLRKTIFLE